MKRYSIILLLTTALLATSCIRHTSEHIITKTTARYINQTEKTLAVACNSEDSLKIMAPADSVEFNFVMDNYVEYKSSLLSHPTHTSGFTRIEQETLYNLTDTTKLSVDLTDMYLPYTDFYESCVSVIYKGDKYYTRTLNVQEQLLKYFTKDPQMTSKFRDFYNK